jgi:hypothetical protein
MNYYRPHFACQTKAGFTDEQVDQYFDSTNSEGMNQVAFLAVGQKALVTLQMDRDAPFIWRALNIGLVPAQGTNFAIKIKDWAGNELTSAFITANAVFCGEGFVPNFGGVFVPLQHQIDGPDGNGMPAGSIIQVEFERLS